MLNWLRLFSRKRRRSSKSPATGERKNKLRGVRDACYVPLCGLFGFGLGSSKVSSLDASQGTPDKDFLEFFGYVPGKQRKKKSPPSPKWVPAEIFDFREWERKPRKRKIFC